MSAIKNLIEFRFIQKYPEYRHRSRNIKFDIEEIPEDKIDAYTEFEYLKRTDNETIYKIEVRDYSRSGYCFADTPTIENYDDVTQLLGEGVAYVVDGVCLAYVKDNKVTDIRNLYWF